MDSPFPELGRSELISFYGDCRHFETEIARQELAKTFTHEPDAIAAWLEAPGVRPNCYFDPQYYGETYGIPHPHSLHHFLTHGWRVGNNPSKDVDIRAFLHARAQDVFSKEKALDDLLIQREARSSGRPLFADIGAFQDFDRSIERSITVVTVNLNNARGLERTLQSVESQSDPCDDLVVVDGGSDDRSLDVIRQHEETIATVLVGKDKGIFDAMNLGVRQAKSEYVLFMNSGDRFENSECLAEVRPQLGYADIVYGLTRLENVETAHPHWRKVSEGMPFCHQSQYTRRCWLERFPFEVRYRAADWRSIATLYLNGATFQHLDSILSVLEPWGFSGQEPIENFLEIWSFSTKSFPRCNVDDHFHRELERRFGSLLDSDKIEPNVQ